MRSIALIVPNINYGGTERVAQLLANFLISKDYFVSVLTMGYKSYPFKLIVIT